ncbi:MAG TPA: ABC transporter ATP-binding protein [Clostridiales bacterium]|nr:ABC transporter ATP-binding protein [Clostridiales bacterium]
MEKVIEIKQLTKDYGDNRGVFDINLDIYKGEMLGFVGSNGAGKTTTIRNIMGFLKPDKGVITIYGLDSWKDSEKTKKYIGYVPGEIAFPDLKTGTEFIKSQAEFLGLKDMSYANYLIEKLQLDPSANLKRMSKGMKQKTAIVVALMANPDILILDEPTTGLDPLMRVSFMEIIKAEKEKGKTILISSHLYEELEHSCDRVALINKGHIVDVAVMEEINNRPVADYKIEFKKKDDYEDFKKLNYNIIRDQKQYNQVTISIDKSKINKLFKDLTMFDVKFIAEVKYTLEKHFNEIIKKEKENNNDK